MSKLPKPVPARLLPTEEDVWLAQLGHLLRGHAQPAWQSVGLAERVMNSWYDGGHYDLAVAAGEALATYYGLVELCSEEQLAHYGADWSALIDYLTT